MVATATWMCWRRRRQNIGGASNIVVVCLATLVPCGGSTSTGGKVVLKR
jgi:hypothetical protein